MFLRGNGPVVPSRTGLVVRRGRDRCAVEGVFRPEGEPAVVFVGGVEPFVAVEEGAVFPVGECGGAPGEGGVFEGDEFGEVRADGAEVVVHPGEGGVVDAVGGDEEVFRVVALGADELGDGGVVDEDLGSY